MEDELARLEAAAIVLAGGMATRMGEDKALVDIGGEPLLKRVIRLLDPIFEQVIVAANHEYELDLPDVTLTMDRIPHQGPLGGIHAGLLASSKEWNFVIACDMPFVNQAVIRHLWSLRDDADTVVPEARDGLEPLHAFYRRTCLPAIEAALSRGERRVVSFFPDALVVTAGLAELSRLGQAEPLFMNVNVQEDLESARRLASSGAPEETEK